MLSATPLLVALLAQAAGATPSPSPVASPKPGPVILFLIDNSASLPPLDPQEKRVEALEKMFTFLEGQPYRLILFGARSELYVDDPSRYRNNGQWTDFYFAFDKARELMQTYPKGTEFRLVLLTDGVLDPSPREWQEMQVPEGEDLKAHVTRRTMDLLEQIGVPLYVILVGAPPSEDVAPGDREQAPVLVLHMVQAANGARASAMAQSLAAFFSDDGLLLRKFVFRVGPEEGLKKLEPVVRRVVAPARAAVEAQLLGSLVLPLVLFLCLLLGILVRSFPGPGDVEILELALGAPAHVSADRFHKVASGGWANTGLSLVGDAREATATLTYQPSSIDVTGTGLDTAGLDEISLRLLPLGLDEFRKTLADFAAWGSKEERIQALNLDYMAKNLETKEAERILGTPPAERRGVPALDFLRAKAHLAGNDALRERLLAPRVLAASYGKSGERKELVPGERFRIGRYTFVAGKLGKGGRKDVRLPLYYDRVPSVLGLKAILPKAFQRLVRFRSSSERVVS
jgi:hypothetical protein